MEENMTDNAEIRLRRPQPGPVTLAALLLWAIESMYARLIEMAELRGDEDLAEELRIEWTLERNKYKPQLERIIRKAAE